MASSLSWNCQVCSAVYASLYDLVRHIRGSHSGEEDLNFTCGVDQCVSVFTKTNTWYRHVVRYHSEHYRKQEMLASQYEESDESDCMAAVFSDDEDQLFSGLSLEPFSSSSSSSPLSPGLLSEHDGTTPSSSSSSSCINKKYTIPIDEQEVAGKLIRLKEKYLISDVAMGEIVDLVKMICDSTVNFAFSAAIDCGLDSEQLLHMLSGINDPLATVKTTYRRQLYIAQNLPYVNPVWYEIGTHIGMQAQTPVNISDGFYYVSLLDSLETLLNNPSIWNQVMSGVHCSDGKIMRDVCDGSIFTTNSILCENERALQIIAYYDEFTLTNPLGSRAKKYKIGAIYFSIANIDPALRSKLEAINLVALFFSSLLNDYSLDDIMKPFVADLKKLSAPEGWEVTIDGQLYKMKGTLLAFVGDTPAVNMVGGFKEGVAFSMRKCRQCMATFDQMQTKFLESDFALRSKVQHNRQCHCIDQPNLSDSERRHYSKVYGINRSSVLVELRDFDVTENLPQDLMHVILEGVFPFHMEVLLEYLHTSDILTRKTINSRMKRYPYAYFNEKPMPIDGVNIKGTQSASQMWEFVDIFPFLVEDTLSLGNPHFACFMLLWELSSIALSPVIAVDQIPYLTILIKQYLEQFTALYPHVSLTPKCHYLVHIPSLIRRYGPLINLWSMRFESKHKEFKNAARRTSFKNILKTLTHHHQRMLAYRLRYDSSFAAVNKVSTGCVHPVTSPQSLPYFDELMTHHRSLLMIPLFRCQNVSILGTLYKAKKCYMMIGVTELPSGTFPQFGHLYDILVHGEEPSILFVFSLVEIHGYDANLGAYVVSNSSQENFQCIYSPIATMRCHYLFNVICHQENMYIKSKYDLSVFCNYDVI